MPRVPLSTVLIRRYSYHLSTSIATKIQRLRNCVVYITEQEEGQEARDRQRERDQERDLDQPCKRDGGWWIGERKTRHEVARVRGGVDAKYRQGCQVAETAAAPLSTGTSWFSPGGCGRRRRLGGAGQGVQGRVIDRGRKGW